MQEWAIGKAILSQLVETLRQHGEIWHARPDAETLPQFVLDDGTGDVELQFVSRDDRIQAILTHRSLEKASQSFPLIFEPRRISQHFDAWLTAELSQLRASEANLRPGQGRTRFMVTLDSNQLERLRELAHQQGVPVAELVRTAVERYLAAI